MPVIEQKTTNKNKVDFDLNRLDKSKTTIFSKYPKSFLLCHKSLDFEADGHVTDLLEDEAIRGTFRKYMGEHNDDN
jgi:hypothetical protein